MLFLLSQSAVKWTSITELCNTVRNYPSITAQYPLFNSGQSIKTTAQCFKVHMQPAIQHIKAYFPQWIKHVTSNKCKLYTVTVRHKKCTMCTLLVLQFISSETKKISLITNDWQLWNSKLYNGLKMLPFGFDTLFDTCIGQSHDHWHSARCLFRTMLQSDVASFHPCF